TGINATKIIRKLQFVNSFARDHCSRARCSVLEVSRQSRRNGKQRSSRNLILDFFLVSFSKLGPVQTGRPPLVGGGGWQSESLRVLNTRQEFGNGTRELRTGSSICGQYGTRNPRLGPGSPGDRVAVHRDLLSGLLGAIQRVGALCFW